MTRRIASIDLAWRVHDTAAASIGKADTKAGFVATLDTAVLAGVLTVADLDRLSATSRALVTIGGVFLAVAVLAAVTVVLPVLRPHQTRVQTDGDWLYFGAVRHHSGDELADRLGTDDAVRGVCTQAVTLARLAWLKHRLLQASMLATMVGSNLVGWTLLLAGGR